MEQVCGWKDSTASLCGEVGCSAPDAHKDTSTPISDWKSKFGVVGSCYNPHYKLLEKVFLCVCVSDSSYLWPSLSSCGEEQRGLVLTRE